MHGKLRDQQVKTISYTQMLYQNLMGTSNQKSTTDTNTQAIQHIIKDSHQTARKEEGGKKSYKNKPKAINQTAIKTCGCLHATPSTVAYQLPLRMGFSRRILEQVVISFSNRNIHINNYFKHKLIKCSNKKTQTG